MLKLRNILQLSKRGKSNRDIAKELGISRQTVNNYVGRMDATGKSPEELLKLNDEELSSHLRVARLGVPPNGRLEDLQSRLISIDASLQKPHTTRFLLWDEYRKDYPEGFSYSQFCYHLSIYQATKKAVMRMNHAAAEYMMFDFAGDKIEVVDSDTGEVHQHPVLVCVLPFSAYTYAEVLYSAEREHLIKALNNAFVYFGGVPLAVKTDNMAQIVKKSNRYEPSFADLAVQWGAHYGITLMTGRVRKPRDKASAESHVNIVYNHIYGPLRNVVFHSLAQANEAFKKQLQLLNARNMQQYGESRLTRFNLYEKAHLLPLPEKLFVPKNKVSAKVQRNYHITLGQDKHHYSVPSQYIGKQVEVIYDSDNVEIYYQSTRIACYERSYRKNAYTTVKEHMPDNHSHYLKMRSWNSEYFLEKAQKIGASTVEVIRKILEQKIFVEQTYNSCLGVLRLGEKYGDERLEAACDRAKRGYKANYTLVKNILERNMDKSNGPDLFSNIPEHENIRGAEFYE